MRQELGAASSEQLYSTPRLYSNLLSSQPLCFNLFAELKVDLDLAKRVLRRFRPGSIHSVDEILFEHSPGRGDNRYTGDRSAFDVFIAMSMTDGSRAFLGIEVKYHENLEGKAARHRARYDEVAAEMGCFRPESLPLLRRQPLQQLWRDHLLAGATKSVAGFSEGVFVFLYPAANTYCRKAVLQYRDCLSDNATFDAWTLEEFVGVLFLEAPTSWARRVYSRYLDFSFLATT